jgi:quercetin dioxygenase-like cupin family protein
MRRIIWTLGLLVTALSTQSSAQHHPASAGQGAPPSLSAGYKDLKWEPIVPELGADSPQVSILRVDPKTQATQLLIRIPKQMHVPLHWHNANETHTVIKGTFVFEHDGMRHQLTAGGFNYLPARMHHQAWASDDALVFITVDGGWDVNWISGPPTSRDLGEPLPSTTN